MMFISVDLPEPEGPMMATISPCCTWNDTPRSAFTSTSPILYVRVTSLTSITGSPGFTAIVSPRRPWDNPRGQMLISQSSPESTAALCRRRRLLDHHHIALVQAARHFRFGVARHAQRHIDGRWLAVLEHRNGPLPAAEL